MVNILYLSNTGSIIGGCENRLTGLIKNLDRSLYNPIVVCPDSGEFSTRLQRLDIPVYIRYLPRWRKASSYPFRRLSAMRLAGLAGKHHIDLVHTSNLWSNYYAWRVGQSLKIPIISHVRDVLKSDRVHKYLFQKFDRIIAISEGIKKPLVSGGIPSEKIEVIYNGIDLSEFGPNIKRTDIIRQDYPFLHQHLVGLIGRIEPFRRQKEFVHVIAEALKVRQDISFLLIGEATRHDYFLEIQKTIAEHNIAEYVIFTGYRRDMAQVLASLDMVVTLSAGGVVIEAMASCLPVIGTDIACTAEMIEDGVTGLLLPQDDIHGVSRAIIRLLEDEDMRNRMGEAGRERAEKLFDVRKYAKLVETVYERVLSVHKTQLRLV